MWWIMNRFTGLRVAAFAGNEINRVNTSKAPLTACVGLISRNVKELSLLQSLGMFGGEGIK